MQRALSWRLQEILPLTGCEAETCNACNYQLNDAPLSLLEALRVKTRWFGAKNFETLGHLDKVLLELAKGQGYASIKHR